MRYARALRAAYLALHRQTNDCFAKDGVTADQFVLLASLAEADAVTQQELVRRVGSDPNTVRAMLLLLEGRGLVARERHPADGRARSCDVDGQGAEGFHEVMGEERAAAGAAADRLAAGRGDRSGGALAPRCRSHGAARRATTACATDEREQIEEDHETVKKG